MSRMRSGFGAILRFKLGLRQEFTTGWNEESGRASNYITGLERRAVDHTAGGQTLYTRKTTRKICSAPRVGLAWDPCG